MADRFFTNNTDDESLKFEQPGFEGFRADPISTHASFLQRPTVRFGIAAAATYGAYKLHTHLLNTNPTYLDKLTNAVKKFEDFSPNYFGRTFGLSERLSSYHIGRSGTFVIPENQLYHETGGLTNYGKWLNNEFQGKVDLNSTVNKELKFTRISPSDNYLRLDINPEIRVKFLDPRGRLASAAYKLNTPTREAIILESGNWSSLSGLHEKFEGIRASQKLASHPLAGSAIGRTDVAAAFHIKVGDSNNRLKLIETEALALAERGQKLMSEYGFGLRRGSYNRLFHIPGFSKGNRGLVNEILFKRVAPVVLGLTALRWLDYQTGHHASNALINIPLKANVIRAEATDKIPGGRSVTNFYQRVVPGAQYAPLALPAAGAFVGGLVHYSKLLAGGYSGAGGETARNEAAKIITPLRKAFKAKSVNEVLELWKDSGSPFKGFVIGAAAMLPFLPGMLGSRKSASELKAIYSGDQDVPIRSGRWWRLGCQIDTNTHLTDQGIKTVAEIYNNKSLKLLNDKGELETPSAWMKYPYEGDVYNIYLNYSEGAESFTPNHRFPVFRDNKIVELRADQLKVGDFLLTSPMVTDESLKEIKVSDYIDGLIESGKLHSTQTNWFTKLIQKSGSHGITDIISCDYDLGFLLGHFMAEGSLNRRNGQPRGLEHSGDIKEIEKFQTINKIYSNKFGYSGTIEHSKENAIKLRISNTILGKLFYKILYKDGYKRLDYDFASKLPIDCLRGILEGWFYGDGTLSESKASIKTKYKSNALIIKKLFSLFGAPASLTKHISNLNGKLFPGYKVSVDLEALNILTGNINLHKHYQVEKACTATKTYAFRILKDYIAYRIKKITTSKYRGDVYDFEVSSNHHYETANCITHNSTPFSGTRITSWRPHWSVLYKSRAKDVSLYSSEKEYWKNNPFLHPFRYIRDPYKLEKLNYEDRPYPITSPAFSNVPLIGPLLAATIGKIVKPPVLMHENEWTPDDYDVYSTRLRPKGPTVESKLERDFLQSLAKRGYAAQTQVQQDNYRIDFAFVGKDGQKIAIETDGASYHGFWNRDKDAKRQRDLENSGWNVIRVGSKDYFKNPEAATDKVIKYLRDNHVQNIDVTGKDIKSGLVGLAPPIPKKEFSLKNAIEREIEIAAEFIGMPGYITKEVFRKIRGKTNKGQEVFLQGSRQMDNWSRQYYENQIGEGLGPNPEGNEGLYGYTEGLRRFIQREPFEPQVNEIPNKMPSWIPGSDYLINFRKGDPFAKIDHGYARLPGKGFAALHPELKDIDPENYPDINKLEILGDVAPYSREFNIYKDKIGNYLSQNQNNAERARYERTLDHVRQIRDSILTYDKRRFTENTDDIKGTVKSVSSKGVELNEYPDRLIKFSSIGLSAADMSAMILGRENVDTKTADSRSGKARAQAMAYIAEKLAPGTQVKVTVPSNSIEHTKTLYGIFNVDGTNINRELVDKGLAPINRDNSTAEYQKMFGPIGRLAGFAAEELSFTGDDKSLLRVIPTPAHSKLWQERTALAQYISQEVVGTRMRRWDRPLDDFLFPYIRGTVNRLTGVEVISKETTKRREFNTLTDMLKYMRGLHNRAKGLGSKYTNEIRRSNIGTDLLGSSIFVASTIPDRDKRYFGKFLEESDPHKRLDILKVVPIEMSKALQAQWAARDAAIAEAEGKPTGIVSSQGRLVNEEGYKEYSKAKTKLGYGDYMRSKEIADFFSSARLRLPEADDSMLWNDNIDYEDVKLKIIENEGYDAHDFNIFDDRSAMLWRKPYINGAVNELTSGSKTKDSEDLRRQVESLMLRSLDKNPDVRVISQVSNTGKGSVKVNIKEDQSKETAKVIQDMRRNPENYKDD